MARTRTEAPGAAVPVPPAGPFGLIQCPDCEGSGRQPVGEHFVTHEMALDAGQPEREGESMGIEYGPCPTCSGNGQVEAPPAGLTVAQLADLLWEGSWELDLDPPARAMMEKLAAWLAPRLSGSPGAPPAARREPTEAMKRAAWDAISGMAASGASPNVFDDAWIDTVLRAALAASPETA